VSAGVRDVRPPTVDITVINSPIGGIHGIATDPDRLYPTHGWSTPARPACDPRPPPAECQIGRRGYIPLHARSTPRSGRCSNSLPLAAPRTSGIVPRTPEWKEPS
jgi:hypothetical protein